MIINKELQGKLICLKPLEPEQGAALFKIWDRDAVYMRFLDSEPPNLWVESESKAFLEEMVPKIYFFTINTREDEKPIGSISLGGFDWIAGNAEVGIGIGEEEYRGRGYGTDAMRVIVRYAFRVLNLRRVSLGVFEYNPRAIRSYEKAGFTEEGRLRQYVNRFGRRWDVVLMGILRSDWEKLRKEEQE